MLILIMKTKDTISQISSGLLYDVTGTQYFPAVKEGSIKILSTIEFYR